MDLTGTFKYSKTDLVRQGFDPAASTDAIYFNNLELGLFTRLDQQLYERIQAGDIRF
jgi:fatty-acyl-CoA synthase